MDKKFAIFDMDGTLVDSTGIWQRLEHLYLAEHGVTENVDEIMEQIKPMTLHEAGAYLIRHFGFSGPPEQFAAEMCAMMEPHYRSDVPLKAGAKEFLERLSRRGVRMCIASSTPEKLVWECLRRLGVADCFDFILSCEEVGFGKTHPDVYMEAARRLGAAVEEVAVYEDAPNAIRTAKSAGFYVVGVRDESAAAYWGEISTLADELVMSWK